MRESYVSRIRIPECTGQIMWELQYHRVVLRHSGGSLAEVGCELTTPSIVTGTVDGSHLPLKAVRLTRSPVLVLAGCAVSGCDEEAQDKITV